MKRFVEGIEGPRFIKIGRAVRYAQSEVRQYI
jgi:hypothetical protein